MSYPSHSSQWLIASTALGHAELLADMIIAGEIKPPNAGKPWLLPVSPSGQIFTGGYAEYRATLAQPLKKRENLRGSQRALYDLVEKEVSEHPVDAEGRMWANLSARRLAEELGLCSDHVRRIYKGNPFRHVIKKINGKKTTLIRIGHPADLTPEDQARMMAKFWRNSLGREESPDEFGCLVGIAKDCPIGLGYDIFRTVVSNWSPFMMGVKIALHLAQGDSGDGFDSNPENFFSRFYVYPTIKVVRRFIYIAADYYETAIQDMSTEAKCPDVCMKILKVIKESDLQTSFISGDTKKKT